ncbi:hypothetical protein ACFSKL_08490 [Belliella marina]|uniref:Photosystem II protein N n=1 Tax=Belliella marina TaxID=1644146 RepID=A0ABW4VJE9_9BACT
MEKTNKYLIQLLIVLSILTGSSLFYVFFSYGEKLGKHLAGIF